MSGAPDSSTPASRFVSASNEGPDSFKESTLGMVHLSEYRKPKIDNWNSEQFEAGKDGQQDHSEKSRTGTKKRKTGKKGVLSFAVDEEDDTARLIDKTSRTAQSTPDADDVQQEQSSAVQASKRLNANGGVGFIAKPRTKSALAREAALKEKYRQEFLAVQERVKATDFAVPFTFYHGTDLPGGTCRMKKGDQIWRFLDKARKLGAGREGGMKQWARISVDDLMLVKNDLIIPHHLEFYYFMLNKVRGFDGEILFPQSSELTAATPETGSEPATAVGLNLPGRQTKKQEPAESEFAVDELEGANDDPTLTKVVDRRWYESHKHIFPASIWQDFDTEKDYPNVVRKDASGNAFFARR